MTRGDNFSFDIVVLIDGKPYLFPVGSDITFTAKSSLTDQDNQALRKALGYGITVQDPVAARVRISLLPADTNALPNVSHTYPYEIKVIDPVSGVTTLMVGALKVNAGVILNPR